ncbi:MAG: SDR family NAD(P)-dependent oxidoreductase [Bacteriovoracaceae bacterium]|nr:SDR family NAD(P)-dependent oxidoreductase [Bacteriovoracaceae bacterium]
MKIFITGGTTGIGLALAETYLQDGHKVGVCGRDLSKLPTGIHQVYPRLKTYQVDVLKKDELGAAINNFSQGELDVLIANAGCPVNKNPKMFDFDSFRQIIDLNVIGVLNTFEAAINLMIHKKRGHLVAIASVAGIVGLPGMAPHSASKAAVIKLCESFSHDLKQWGIDVTAIAPGHINTALSKQKSPKLPFMVTPSKAAVKIKKAIAKKKNLYIFPLPIKIIICFLDKIPRFFFRLFLKKEYFSFLHQRTWKIDEV